MVISKYRKKPVVIEAVQLTWENLHEVMVWCGAKYYSRPPGRQITGCIIYTLEGDMVAEPGDWIIRGIKGEFYPCKDDVFRMTYDEVH